MDDSFLSAYAEEARRNGEMSNWALEELERQGMPQQRAELEHRLQRHQLVEAGEQCTSMTLTSS